MEKPTNKNSEHTIGNKKEATPFLNASEQTLAKESIIYINKIQVHVSDIKFISGNSYL